MQSRRHTSVEQKTTRFHPDRVTGGDFHHRHADVIDSSGHSKRPRSGAKNTVPEQHPQRDYGRIELRVVKQEPTASLGLLPIG